MYSVPVLNRHRWSGAAAVTLALIAGGCSSSTVEFTAGECVNLPEEETIDSYETVDCAEVHDGEVYALPTTPDGEDAEYPGETALDDLAVEQCEGDSFESYVGVPYEDSAYFFVTLLPSQESWEQADDREIVCLLVGEPVEDDDGFSQLTGSKKDSNE